MGAQGDMSSAISAKTQRPQQPPQEHPVKVNKTLAPLQFALHEESLRDPIGFWSKAAKDIHWHRPCNKVLEHNPAKYGEPGYAWFPNGQLNTAYNCLDRHIVEGNGDRTAIIYDSPVTNTKSHISYRDLTTRVATFASVLQDLGVKKGSNVIVYMPMVPEAVVAMLACARLGAIHSVVFGGFAPKELAKRIDDCQPNVVISATCGIEPKKIIKYKPLLSRAIELSKFKPQHKIFLVRDQCPEPCDPKLGEIDWVQEEAKAKAQGRQADCTIVSALDPLYLLYTSGSTGVPKGVIRDNGGHAVALRWTMENICGVKPGDVFCAASDVGWVVGHSFIVYGPLLMGCTTVIYEGKPVGTPDAGAFWRLVQEYKVKSLFTAPTAIRAIKREDSTGEEIKKYDLSSLKNLFLVGERSDPDTVATYSRFLNIPIRDNWWQTETGWPMTVACEMQSRSQSSAIKLGSAGPPIPGYDVRVLVPAPGSRVKEDGEDHAHGEIEYVEAPPNTLGTLAVKLPLPPGTFPTLWHNHKGYVKSYFSKFPGYYDTADSGLIDQDGYVSIMSRTDDIINTAGHRLSTGGMEEIVSGHPALAECAVIGARDHLKGEKPLGFVVLKASAKSVPPAQIKSELSNMMRTHLGAIACFDTTVVVDRLPKTRSGKILRRTLRAIANGDPYDVPATIEDESVLGDVAAALAHERAAQSAKLPAKL
ncbi:propionyl-CoA synthetase [Phlyctochytrium arcticum]|nr:propionyl-CoA synthetase [Phlyctochytrium arcticum]